MRSYWYALRIAVIFTVVMGAVLAGTLVLFGRVTGHELLRDLGMLRVHQGVLLAELVEQQGRLESNDSDSVGQLLRAAAPPGTEAEIVTGARDRSPRSWFTHFELPQPGTIEIRGRQCEIPQPPDFTARVPLFEDQRQVGELLLKGPLHQPVSHHRFLVGLARIGLVALSGVICLAVYLTAPLRRMRGSMDRIAAGDLEHRVPVKGSDEVSAMGTSFNLMADRIAAMIRGQKELLAGVSHELRSPLTRMKMVLELLRPTSAQPDRLDDLTAEVDTLNHMVEEILEASRLDLGVSELTLHRLDVAEMVDSAWASVAPAAEAAGMKLELQVGENADQVSADRATVERALRNLFENSIRYAGSGVVTVTSQRSGHRVELMVADDGPGVPDDALDRLFDPFFRVDPSRSRRTGASGLGLMIVRRTAEAHAGIARAEKSSSGGLVISFDLPACS